MVVRAWHLLVVGAVAVSALTAIVTLAHVGRGAAHETKAIALVPAAMSVEAAEATAEANVRSAVPSIEAFYADHGSYLGATIAALREIDSGIGSTAAVGWVSSGRYCLQSTVDAQTASFTGPGGDVAPGACQPG